MAVVCRSGGRSAQVVGYLLNNGWEQVRNVDGGMRAWAAAGRPVVSETGNPARSSEAATRIMAEPLVFAHRGSSAACPSTPSPRTYAPSTRASTGLSATCG